MSTLRWHRTPPGGRVSGLRRHRRHQRATREQLGRSPRRAGQGAEVTRDPLEGYREAINEGSITVLVWVDDGKGKPVEQGQLFRLRSCHVLITRIERKGPKGGPWVWVAHFDRLNPDRVNLLRHGRGYTADEKEAMKVHDAPVAEALTLVELEPDPKEPGGAEALASQRQDPPEPEAVDPREVANYSGSEIARRRYDREMAEQRLALEQLPLHERLRRFLELAEQQGVDVNRQVRAITGKVAEGERKVGERRAA